MATVRSNTRRVGRKPSTLTIMTKVRELTLYIFVICEKSAQKYRLTFVNRLQNYALDAVQNIYLANKEMNAETRKDLQEKAKTTLEMIDYFACLSFEAHVILDKQYEHISLLVAESFRLMKKWQDSDLANPKLVSTLRSSI
jgi:hypothetical protein